MNRRSPADVPEDRVLPALARVLDAGWVGDILTDHQGGGAGRLVCRASYVRYKPGTSCVVAYEFEPDGSTPPAGYMKLYSGSDFPAACAKLSTRHWWTDEWYPPYVVLNELHAILFLFPNDAEMDGLRLFARPKGVQRVLYANTTEFPAERWRISDRKIRVRVVRYKPEKRAVVRIETRAVDRRSGERRDVVVFGRVYDDGRTRARSALMRSLEREIRESAVRTPHVLGCLPDHGVVLVARLDGIPVDGGGLVTGEGGRGLLVRAGAALRALHSCRPDPLEPKTRAEALEECVATTRSIGAVAPDLARRSGAVMERLYALSNRVPSSATGFTHGDFHPGQLLESEESIGVLDFDRSHYGEVLADLGNFRAHLLASDRGTPATREAAARALAEGYTGDSKVRPDRAGLDLWTGIGLLNLAIQPFRALDRAWRERIASLISRCEEVMR